MASKQGTGVKSGFVEVAEVGAGKAVKLTNENINCIGVFITADPNNEGENIVIGDKTVQVKGSAKKPENIGFNLNKFTSVFIEVQDPSTIFVGVSAAKDHVLWTAVLA